MTSQVTGGIRARLIHDSLFALVRQGLTDLGWFDAVPNRRTVSLSPSPIAPGTEIEPNLVTVSEEDHDGVEAELGSSATDDTRTFYVEVYAENESVGQHLKGDLIAILRGQNAAIGRTTPTLPVLDFRLSTPDVLFVCPLSGIRSGRSLNAARPYERTTWAIRVVVEDDGVRP